MHAHTHTIITERAPSVHTRRTTPPPALQGSNVSKATRARADAAKKLAAEGKGGGGASGKAERMGAGAMNTLCSVCRQTFMVRAGVGRGRGEPRRFL